jgi:bifunctional DNase/RNase
MLEELKPMEVVGVRVEMPSNQPIILVKEIDGARYLPIWVGAVEATAIAFAQQGMTPHRPLTHDLLVNALAHFDKKISSVHLTELKDGVYYSMINFVDGSSISARPSDSLALAIRVRAPILATQQLLMEAAIEIPEQADDEVEAFREFLDQINPEDFAS